MLCEPWNLHTSIIFSFFSESQIVGSMISIKFIFLYTFLHSFSIYLLIFSNWIKDWFLQHYHLIVVINELGRVKLITHEQITWLQFSERCSPSRLDKHRWYKFSHFWTEAWFWQPFTVYNFSSSLFTTLTLEGQFPW